MGIVAVSYTHLRAHETDSYLVCRLLLEKTAATAAVYWQPPQPRTDRVQRQPPFFQAEDGIRDRSPPRGLGDVYKRQLLISIS